MKALGASGGDEHSREASRASVLSFRHGLLILLLAALGGSLILSPRTHRGRTGSQVHLTPDADGFFSGVVEPKDYTEQSFNETLQQLLTPGEITLVVNPLASPPGLNELARRLTADATNELEKARALYIAVASRIRTDPVQFAQPPPVSEIFVAWQKPDEPLGCQELAFMFTALARVVGLKAYHVFVEQDLRGVNMMHGCAGVFLNGRMILIDPAFSTFGVAHRRFTVLDDIQTTGLYLAGRQNLTVALVACKLAPHLTLVQSSVFQSLIRAGRWDEARTIIPTLARLDPSGPAIYDAEADLAEHDAKFVEAIKLRRKAVELAPETPQLHNALGYAYMHAGRWQEARGAFENALKYAVYIRSAETARGGTAWCEAMDCSAKQDWQCALTNLDIVLRNWGDWAGGYRARSVAKMNQGDADGALVDAARAVKLDPDNPDAHLAFGSAKYAKGDSDGAFADYKRVLELNPDRVDALKLLGWIEYDRHEFANALSDLRRYCTLGPTAPGPADDYMRYMRYRIWMTRVRLGEMNSANVELESFVGSRDRSSSTNWVARIGNFLLGQTSEADFLTAAQESTNVSVHAEAWFYAGSKRLLSGDKDIAATDFRQCVATRASGVLETVSAASELRFLQGETNAWAN